MKTQKPWQFGLVWAVFNLFFLLVLFLGVWTVYHGVGNLTTITWLKFGEPIYIAISVAAMVIFGLGQWFLLRNLAPIPYSWGLFNTAVWVSGAIGMALTALGASGSTSSGIQGQLLCLSPMVLIFVNEGWLRNLLKDYVPKYDRVVLSRILSFFILIAGTVLPSVGLGAGRVMNSTSSPLASGELLFILICLAPYPLITGITAALALKNKNEK
jgi:hypothetical protein